MLLGFGGAACLVFISHGESYKDPEASLCKAGYWFVVCELRCLEA